MYTGLETQSTKGKNVKVLDAKRLELELIGSSSRPQYPTTFPVRKGLTSTLLKMVAPMGLVALLKSVTFCNSHYQK